MDTQVPDSQAREKVYWHAAFFEALQLELHQYLDALNFVDEHPLSKEALIIDVLVIKKAHDVVIEKNIGRIFKDINLFEFKSEKDSLTIQGYNKVMGYAYLYASFAPAHISDITVSFVVTVHPKSLLNYLQHDRGFTVKDAGNGIYCIEGDTFPVQILESKKLSPDKNLFLKNLRSNLNIEDAQRIVDAYMRLKEFESKNAYIDRLIRANQDVFKEVLSMSSMTLQEIFVKAVAEENGWLKDRDLENAKAIARGFKQDDIPVHIIVKNTGLTLQEVEAL